MKKVSFWVQSWGQNSHHEDGGSVLFQDNHQRKTNRKEVRVEKWGEGTSS